MQKKYVVQLTENEKADLEKIAYNPQEKVKTALKAKILLKMNEGQKEGAWHDQRIAQSFGFSLETVFRIRRQFVKEGYKAVLSRRPYPRGIRYKLHGDAEAKLIALYSSAPPEGRTSWSLRLLANKAIELGIVESISHEGIRQMLKKANVDLRRTSSKL